MAADWPGVAASTVVEACLVKHVNLCQLGQQHTQKAAPMDSKCEHQTHLVRMGQCLSDLMKLGIALGAEVLGHPQTSCL